MDPSSLPKFQAKLKVANLDSDFKGDQLSQPLDRTPAQHSVRGGLGHPRPGPWARVSVLSEAPGPVPPPLSHLRACRPCPCAAQNSSAVAMLLKLRGPCQASFLRLILGQLTLNLLPLPPPSESEHIFLAFVEQSLLDVFCRIDCCTQHLK